MQRIKGKANSIYVGVGHHFGTSPSIASLVKPDVVTVESGANVSEVARMMTQKSVRNVFVKKAGRDIISKVVAFNLDPDMVSVDEIMYTPVPTVKVDAELSHIAALMAESGVRRVLVTDENERILGTIIAGVLLSLVSTFPKTSLREIYRKIQRET